MSRKRSRKVLYEVSSEAKKARSKRPRLEIAKRARAFTKKVTSGRAVDDIKEKSAIKPVGLKRNFIVLVGRLMNFSVKKALILLVILIVVIKFWPVSKTAEPVEPGPETGSGYTVKTEGAGGTVEREPEPTGNEGVGEAGSEVAGPPKDHYIVIASHTELDQLKALAGYFAINGIATEFKVSGDWHTLITKDRYLKPGDLQSTIDEAKAKIKKIGGEYEPSEGYKPFKFDDIYEKKVR